MTQASSPHAAGTAALRCAAIDYGAKKNILRCLVQVGFQVRVFSATATAEEILAEEMLAEEEAENARAQAARTQTTGTN